MTDSLTSYEEILAHPRQLSPEHTEVVRQTLPVIGANIDTITPLFYSKMFDAHPELLANTFNRGNQKLGAQQRALAASIATFASLLVDGRSPVDMLARIGHKHASLGITPEQYQIVHDNLFAAIIEVLGDAVTDEVAAAWDEVYWIMAAVLIDFEKSLYADAGVEIGDVFRTAKIVAREDVTDTVAVFTLGATTDGDKLPSFRPGQYTSVGVRLPDGARQLRQYSLSNTPEDGTWRIGVRRVDATDTPAGEVSTWMHENLAVGDELEVTLPFGDLTLDPAGNNPVVLISAGIGITPMLGMLRQALSDGSDRPVVVLHADRSPAEHVLASEVRAHTTGVDRVEVHTWYEQDAKAADGPGAVHSGRMDLGAVSIPENAHLFLCGGTGFLQVIRQAVIDAGVDADRIHAELFAPNDWLV